jgi:hypothetical protein
MDTLDVYVVVGLCAIGLLQVLETSPCRGGAAKNLIDSIIFLSFWQRRARRSGAGVP